jgi:hypothetical protein
MREEVVKDNRDYVRVDGSFIVNRNDNDYRAALLRRKTSNRIETIEKRVESLEYKLDQIIKLLSEKI